MKLTTLSLLLSIITYDAVSASNELVVDTRYGRVKGKINVVKDIKVKTFMGVPFAQPPVGEYRFKEAKPLTPWKGVYDAINPPPSCYQSKEVRNVSEDCLYLNVWTKAKSDQKSLRSVMVWIFGGGFSEGGSTDADGAVLAALHDVIVVTFNYRVGAFGFLNTFSEDAPGNVGFRDQIEALRWVSENIKNFGGDPKDVTIFGESAGSRSVHMHLLSPLSRGLFRRAIMMSGCQYHPLAMDSPEVSASKTILLAEKLKCSSHNQSDPSSTEKLVRCLRNVEPDLIVEGAGFFPRSFYPTHSGDIIPSSPITQCNERKFYNGDLLIGSLTGDGVYIADYLPVKITVSDLSDISVEELTTIMKSAAERSTMYPLGTANNFKFYLKKAGTNKQAIRQSGRDFIGDNFYICPLNFFAELYAENGNNVYKYQFSHLTKHLRFPYWIKAAHGSEMPEWIGAPHADELPYVFGKPLVSGTYTEEEKELSKKIMDVWTTFAKTGKPPNVNGNQWPLFTKKNQLYINMDVNKFEQLSSLRKEFCEFWRPYINKTEKITLN